MKDIEIISDMLFCSNLDCEHCSRQHSERCAINLMKDARSVMLLQHNALVGFEEELANLKEENERLQPMLKYGFTEEQLVKVVNNIIEDCCYCIVDEDTEDEEYSYVNMLKSILAFGQMLPSGYKVEISSVNSAPKLVKK